MIRKAYIAMCRAFPGGIASMATTLGYSYDALKNRIYEKKGQTITVNDALLMQEFSGTKFFANEIARRSGGVFLEVIPEALQDRTEMLTEFNRLTEELGQLSSKYERAVRDGQIDNEEQVVLKDQAYRIHKQLERILAVSFALYRREDDDVEK